MAGIIIIITAASIEIALALFSIVTKSNKPVIRGIIRLSYLICFVLLTILSVIQWSFRYYALAVLLLSLALIGTIPLIRKPKEKPYKHAHTLLKTFGMIILISLCTLPAILFPQYKPIAPTGSYQVGTVDYTYIDTHSIETYTDTGEYRKVNVEFTYPLNTNGRYPLIVFSPGTFGTKTSNTTLYNELASHGYIVCSIDHPYHALFTTGTKGRTVFIDGDYFKDFAAEDAKNNKQQSLEFYRKWMAVRTGDISLVINSILTAANNQNSGTIYQRIDTTKLGVMGHSLGGSAALGIGRIRNDIDAVIALEAPFMCDIEGVENNTFIFNQAPYPVPVLNVYSDSSWGHLADWPQYAENYRLLSDLNPNTNNIYIDGSRHLGLTDLSLLSPFFTRVLNGQSQTIDAVTCLQTLNKICLQFFDSTLKNEGSFIGNADTPSSQ